MPNLAYPLANSIITKFSDPDNATFVQGFSYAIIHVGYIAGRVSISFDGDYYILFIHSSILDSKERKKERKKGRKEEGREGGRAQNF